MELEAQTKKVKKTKPKKSQKELQDAVPPHILNIVMGVDQKAKRRKKKEQEEQGMDSIALIRNMMSSVRTKCELSEAAEEVRKDKEQDMRMISNARGIFKTLEETDGGEYQEKEGLSREKVKRVEVAPDFLLSGQNKAEELRLERLKEMNAMKMARERQLEEEERMRATEINRENLMKRQRENEIEMMRYARQQALEEEEMRQQMEASQRNVREISPGLAAARQGIKMEDRIEEEDRTERMRLEREREINEMRRARQIQQQYEQEDNRRQEKSEASRELETFRAANQQNGNIRSRYPEQQGLDNCRQVEVAAAPRRKAIGDNWMRRDNDEDKMEELRRAREMELEMMLNARNIAFEEEEEERRAIEAARRDEAERKGREMAMLVAELQRMKNETQQEADMNPAMTKYQEEMLQRVMELQAISAGQAMYQE